MCPRVITADQSRVQNPVAKRYAGLYCKDTEVKIKSLMITKTDLIVDRIVEGVAEVISGADAGKLLYRLTNLQEATIEITADSVDAVDGQGTLIKTFYRG